MPETIINLIEKSLLVLFVIFATCGILIYCPSVASDLGLTKFVESNKPYIGVGFLITGLTLFGKVFQWGYTRWNQHNYFKKTISNLTSEEIEIIKNFIESKSDTQQLSIQSGVVGGLVAKKIIVRATNVGHTGFGFIFDHNLQSWVRGYLNHNGKLK